MIAALSRAGSALFWRVGETAPLGTRSPLLPSLAAALLLAGSALLMAAAGPVTAFTRAAALQLEDRAGYVEAVLGNRGLTPSDYRPGGAP